MSEESKDVVQVTQLAIEIAKYVQDLLSPELSKHPDVTEALFLAMQMLGGPYQTARVLPDYFVKTS